MEHIETLDVVQENLTYDDATAADFAALEGVGEQKLAQETEDYGAEGLTEEEPVTIQ